MSVNPDLGGGLGLSVPWASARWPARWSAIADDAGDVRLKIDPGTFHDTYFPLAYAYFRRRTPDEASAEDLTAITFERILHGLGSFRPRSDDADRDTRIWVYRVAANVYKNHLRSQGREQSRVVRFLRDRKLHVDERQQTELRLTLEQALQRLDPQDRDILGLHYWESLTAAQIACIQACTQREVYTVLARCHRQLRMYLGSGIVGGQACDET